MRYRRHGLALALVIAGSFAVLGGYAPRSRSSAPPIPARVVGPDGEPLLDGDAILRGRSVCTGRHVEEGSTEEEGAAREPGRA